MPREVRQKNMKESDGTKKCSILGPQNLGSRGGLGPWTPLDPHLGVANLPHIHFEIDYLFRFESEKCRILEFSLNGTETQ